MTAVLFMKFYQCEPEFYADITLSLFDRKQSSDLGRRSSSNHIPGDAGHGVTSMTRSNTLVSLDGLTLGGERGGGSGAEEDSNTSKGSDSPTEDGKLLVFQFTVDKLSLEVTLWIKSAY